jgi:hypothetical protein
MMEIQFGIRVEYWIFPYISMLFECLQTQSLGAALPHVLGMISGHIYHFFTIIWPKMGGKRIMKVPHLMERLYNEKSTNKMKSNKTTKGGKVSSETTSSTRKKSRVSFFNKMNSMFKSKAKPDTKANDIETKKTSLQKEKKQDNGDQSSLPTNYKLKKTTTKPPKKVINRVGKNKPTTTATTRAEKRKEKRSDSPPLKETDMKAKDVVKQKETTNKKKKKIEKKKDLKKKKTGQNQG